MSVNYSANKIKERISGILNLCKLNEDLYKSDNIDKQNELMVKIREWDPVFYNRHYRIVKTIVYENGEGLDKLFEMLIKLKEIELNKITLDKADEEVAGSLNDKYINPVLNKKELVEERERKMKEEKSNK